jgi:quaternary ammonium compound-resistance protein SugE
LVTLVTASGSFFLLAVAMRSLPLGTAYMIWTGIGAIGAFAVGVLVMGEPASSPRLAAACLILSGLVLMKLSA